MRVLCVFFRDGAKLDLLKLAEIFYRFSPQIAVREGEALFLEIGQCQKIFREEMLVLRVQALLKRLGLSAQVVVSDDGPTALAMARFQVPHKNFLPLEAFFDFMNPFEKLDAVTIRKIEKVLWALEQLGLKNLVDVLTIRPQEFSVRFGELGLLVYQRVVSAQSVVWPRWVPIEKVVEVYDWSHERSVEGMDEILFHLKTLVDRAVLRLFGRGERLLSFELTLEFEKHSRLRAPTKSWKFELTLPQTSTRVILSLVRERLRYDFEQRAGGDHSEFVDWAPIKGVELKVLNVAPALHAQRDLFNPKKEQDKEAWNSLVGRLTLKLGSEHVFVAEPRENFLPEKSWRKVMHELEMGATGVGAVGAGAKVIPFPERPTRLLRNPVPLNVVGRRLHAEWGADLGDQMWRVRSWDGPEILSGQWWDEPFERMYFRIQAESGDELWVYRTPDTDKVFLHGFFD